MMQLDDFRVPGNEIQVNGDLELKTEDIAGETSGTDSVEKGISPKVLRVSLIIRFQDQNNLNALIKKAESLNDAGERTIYTITNRTANAAGIRQVRFFDHMNWNEDGTLQLWKLSFSLQEYMSNPERVENRIVKPCKPGADASKDDRTSDISNSELLYGEQYSQILAAAEGNFIS